MIGIENKRITIIRVFHHPLPTQEEEEEENLRLIFRVIIRKKINGEKFDLTWEISTLIPAVFESHPKSLIPAPSNGLPSISLVSRCFRFL